VSSPAPRASNLVEALSLRPRFIVGLGLVAVLAVGQYLLLSHEIAEQQRIAVALNAAGFQRSLVQRVALYAGRLAAPAPAGDQNADRRALTTALDLLERRKQQLNDPASELNPRGWPPDAVRSIYFDEQPPLDRELDAFIAAARRIATLPSESVPLDREDLAAVADRQEPLFRSLDRAVKAYLEDAAVRNDRLSSVEGGTFAALIILLIGVFYVLFRPAEGKIKQQRAELLHENDSLANVLRSSRTLVEALSSEALVIRFIEGATRILGVEALPVASSELDLVAAPRPIPLEGLIPSEQALVREASGDAALRANADATFVAYAIALPPGERRLTIVARSSEPIAHGDLTALELFGSFLVLAVRNASLFENLRDREARIAELDKLKSDLIAMLAHDFRGSLTTIIGYAELLKEGLIAGDEVASAAQTIEGAAWRLTHLAADTLTMSQLERNEIVLNRAPVDLVELLVEAIHGFGQSERITFDSDEPTLFVDCDARRIHQVLENLIGNALKYSVPAAPVTIHLSRDGESAHVAITDAGIGIPQADLRRVFERFARADNAKRAGIKGSGFGLYLSRMLVELHGGTIAVTSEEGRGSTFTLSLPLNVDAAQPAAIAVTDQR
jgi:signal transduction histidine kinase